MWPKFTQLYKNLIKSITCIHKYCNGEHPFRSWEIDFYSTLFERWDHKLPHGELCIPDIKTIWKKSVTLSTAAIATATPATGFASARSIFCHCSFTLTHFVGYNYEFMHKNFGPFSEMNGILSVLVNTCLRRDTPSIGFRPFLGRVFFIGDINWFWYIIRIGCSKKRDFVFISQSTFSALFLWADTDLVSRHGSSERKKPKT